MPIILLCTDRTKFFPDRGSDRQQITSAKEIKLSRWNVSHGTLKICEEIFCAFRKEQKVPQFLNRFLIAAMQEVIY